MELTWLADIPQSRRRTRALRACANCQRKKKRCRHLGAENSSSDQNPFRSNHYKSHDSPIHHKLAYSPAPREHDQGSTPTPQSPDVSRTERFVGDLNPEALIRDKLDAASEGQLRDRIGLWISTPVPQRRMGDSADLSNPNITMLGQAHEQSHEPQSVVSALNHRYVSAIKACERLPPTTRDQLVSRYFDRVNHILPLVDRDSFISQEPRSVFLERAICLVAAKDKGAELFLRLTTDGPLVSSRQFCSNVYKGLVVAMDAGLEPDRVTRIRTLALMSLHCEGYEGAEAASSHLCQAIHQAQTAGLHISRPGQVLGDSISQLFWCLWTLDKMHACIGGRPVLLADRDIGIEKPKVKMSHSKSAFDIWFAISDLLAIVISYYRPTADHTISWEADFPTFEEIIGDHVRNDLDFATLGFLELFYHAVGILSCRYTLSDRPDGSKPSYIRQGLAAIRVQSIVATECFQDLPPLPIVPYSLTLSMGVSYQQFRSSKLITHFDRAKASLEACCTLLEGLGVFWYSAEAMARLGRKALQQIDGVELQPEGHRNGHYPGHLMNSGIPSTVSGNAELPMLPYNHTRSWDDRPPTTFVEDTAPGSLDTPRNAIQTPDPGSFADIDILFGDFLDLSLPTNFWDPVFFTENHSGT